MDEEVEQDLEQDLERRRQYESDSEEEESGGEEKPIPLEEELEDYEEDNGDVQFEPFNLRNEREDGHFENGSFVQERGHRYDVWLDAAQPSGTQPTQSKTQSKTKTAPSNVPKHDSGTEEDVIEALKSIIELLEPAETPLEALENDEYDESHAERVTAACEVLVTEYTDIYDLAREILKRELTKRAGRPLKRKRQTEYEFQWPDQQDVHGPYSAQEISDWIAAGYFTDKVKIRQVGEKWGSLEDFHV